MNASLSQAHTVTGSRDIYLEIFSVGIRVRCADAASERLIDAGYGAFRVSPRSCQLDVAVASDGAGERYALQCESLAVQGTDLDRYDFLYRFEKELTLALESIRADLYFLHGAALRYRDSVCALLAPSGSGKSTTTYALLHHGFDYLSDELAPIDQSTLTVIPYPHALCLKRPPPAPYSLPGSTVHTDRTLHVPAQNLPSHICTTALPLTAIFFVQYDAQAAAPSVSPMPPAEAAARIYANGLNQLAHAGKGLPAAAAIAARVASYRLTSADLAATCALVRETLDCAPE